MAVIIREDYGKKKIRFSTFLKISAIIFIVGIILNNAGMIANFWGELCIFIGGAVFLAGILHAIMHHIFYLTDSKIEKTASWLFYIGLASLALRFLSGLIFVESSYVDVRLHFEIYRVVMFLLQIGSSLFFISLFLFLFKFRKLFQIISKL